MAGPKLIIIERDAKIACLNALAAALHSAAEMVHAKAMIDGVTDTRVDINDDGVRRWAGYTRTRFLHLTLENYSGFT